MKRIYLDHAATTPLEPRVAKAIRDFELKVYGNPSSTHREGQIARAKIDTARESIAKFLNAQPQEIIFTSGATEANNMVIYGAITNYMLTHQKIPHVVTTKLEHQSVYNSIKHYQKLGIIEATFVTPDKDGQIQASDVIAAVKENTVLVSVIFVSNEIGTILPVREIGNQLTTFNLQHTTKILFHVDAAQATKFYNCNVEKIKCDLLTISAHKVYGPKGIGALFVKSGTKLNNLLYGGSQEYGKRPGTQNTTGIIGMAKAFELLGTLDERQKQANKIAKLRDKLISRLEKISGVELNGPKGESRAADNVSVTIYDLDQDAFMTALDLAGIAASTGSACVSGSSEPSHVIEALGKIRERLAATVRFTLGKDTKNSDINYVIINLKKIIRKLRA